jgi:hypothetical protein
MKIMKKILPIVIIGVLVLSGLGAAAFTSNVSVKLAMIVKNESTSVLFSSQPTQQEKDGFVSLEMSGATTQLLEPNKPVLPIYVKTYEIPFGSTNIQVICNPQDIGTMTLTKEVIPTRITPLSDLSESTPYVKDSSVYGSSAFYPDSWYSYDLGAGRNENDQQVTFVKVVCHPVRYSPVNNQVDYAGGFEINVNYDVPATQSKTLDASYDMVIIAPSDFSSALQPLVEHKNSHGVETKLVSLEEIYANYEGRDQAEKIKYFIKNALEEYGITYVMLVGSYDKLPIRYSQLRDSRDPYYEAQFVSDLYYADIYNSGGNFDNWDPNGNGLYAEWPDGWSIGEKVDLYPDVYVGRLACRNIYAVKIMVDKIIAYEDNTYGAPWFKTMVVVGGDTFNDSYYGDDTNYFEGEEATAKALEIMEGFTPVKVWASNRDTGGLVPIPRDILKAINPGCGFAYFCGHGSPRMWDTLWPDDFIKGDRAKGFRLFDMLFLFNGYKAPVLMIGGCHNSQFNVSYDCFAWYFVNKKGGGAIASIGCTGYGVDGVGDWYNDGIPDCIQYYDGYFETSFFQKYKDGKDILGATFGQTVTGYLNTFMIEGQLYPRFDTKEVESRVLLGDPSLKIGGYP